eukprot:2780603-Rhodomonas_salina.1
MAGAGSELRVTRPGSRSLMPARKSRPPLCREPAEWGTWMQRPTRVLLLDAHPTIPIRASCNGTRVPGYPGTGEFVLVPSWFCFVPDCIQWYKNKTKQNEAPVGITPGYPGTPSTSVPCIAQYSGKNGIAETPRRT